MIKITRKQFYAVHKDYRGRWSSQTQPHLIGRRTVMSGSIGLPIGSLAIEGINFEIVKEPKR